MNNDLHRQSVGSVVELLDECVPARGGASGALSVFLGMCPGVGKMDALREAALAKKQAGFCVLRAAWLPGTWAPQPEGISRIASPEWDEFPVWDGAGREENIGGRRQLVIWGDLWEDGPERETGQKFSGRAGDLEALRRCLESGVDVFCTANVSGIVSQERACEENRRGLLKESVEALFADYLEEMRWVDLPGWQLKSRMEEFPQRFAAWKERWGADFFEEMNLEILRGQTGEVMSAYWAGRRNTHKLGKEGREVRFDKMDEAASSEVAEVGGERLQGALLDALAHELKSPIAVLVAGLDAAVPDWGALRQAAGRLRHTVEHLLDSARLDSAGAELCREWCEVAELVREALALSAPGPREIQVEIPEKTPLVLVDGRLISQALSTLISNALAYSPAHKPIRIWAEGGMGAPDPTLHLGIEDEGPGIPSGMEQRIFERFYRCPGTPPGGVGLGLSIARRLVESHGGTVSMENRSEGGALFTISLPVLRGVFFPGEVIS